MYFCCTYHCNMNHHCVRYGLCLFCLLHVIAVHGWPPPGIPVDSSYTLENEWNKHRKTYPFIVKAVAMPLKDSVECLLDQVYDRPNGRPLHVDLFLPKWPKKSHPPVVAMIHGGGWRSGDKIMNHYMANELAKKGYAAISIEYRLSMEALYPAALQDVKTAIRWIRHQSNTYGWNASHVALMGCSSGGQMAALLGALNKPYAPYQTAAYADCSDTVQAVIDVDGVLAFIHPSSSEGADKPGKPSAATRWFGVSVHENPALWLEASALNHLHAGSAPMLFINSAQPRFSAGQSETMATLEKWGTLTKAHKLENAPHSFWLFHPWVNQTVNWIADFLEQCWPEGGTPLH